jgi:hypothetical protein
MEGETVGLNGVVTLAVPPAGGANMARRTPLAAAAF